MPSKMRGMIAAAMFMLAAGHASAQVVVSSKIDTEGGVLGNIIILMLEANGIATENRLQLGATPIVREAIKAGEIDIYPEYTGNAAFFYDRAGEEIWNDPTAGYEEAKKLDHDAEKIVWLTPAPANNTWAIAVTNDVAQQSNLKTMTDFASWVNNGGEVKLAASAEFVNSEAGLPSFQKVYNFTLSSDQLITLSGGDTAATIQAAARGTNGANAAMVYGTDGGIAASGLVVLEDDQHSQPIYNPAPIIREEVLNANPQIADILAPVFTALDLTTLQELNGRVQVGGEPSNAVAEDFLQTKGFLK
ncbi:ABC transporter substrate-binding protein [Chelativorans composti]|jgi:Periplasmic glycine betaine/choline-binding (lipo)protein of an ABC-type transport system (osmoprotectant binding protein)|uniref:ABC transporter substrate-binding protein n=1 Tax=Chelativorans composti TaxID=768533 RepID=A0ABW5DDT1_9HYPH